MKKTKPQSGFVYLARHPEHPTWIKIGFTRRSPYHRLQQLSGTSVRSSFEFIKGVFVWNAILSEKTLHQWLEQQNISKQKEFFEVDISKAQELLCDIEDYDARHHRTLKLTVVNTPTEEQWDDFEKNLSSDFDDYIAQQDVKAWNVFDLESHRKWKQALGQRQLEKLSSEGDAEASLILAEHIINISLDEQHWRHADCLYQAAVKQGEPAAQLRSAFWKTHGCPTSLNEYWALLHPWRDAMTNNQNVPDLVRQTFADEQQLWKSQPDRAQSFSEWSSTSVPRFL